MELGGAVAKNNVKRLREAQLMSKAELARKAGVSTLTIDRVEKGKSCRRINGFFLKGLIGEVYIQNSACVSWHIHFRGPPFLYPVLRPHRDNSGHIYRSCRSLLKMKCRILYPN